MTTMQQLVIGGVIFLFGIGLGSMGETETRTVTETETVTETREVTPESCRTAIRIDNRIFKKMGGALQSFDAQQMNDAADYINKVTDRRNQNARDCLDSRPNINQGA